MKHSEFWGYYALIIRNGRRIDGYRVRRSAGPGYHLKHKRSQRQPLQMLWDSPWKQMLLHGQSPAGGSH